MNLIAPLLPILWLAGAPESLPASQPGPAPARIAPQLDVLIRQLGDLRFDVRENATRRLCQADPAIVAPLVDRYKSETSHERKLRLRQVIENLFIRRQMQGEVGFFGIQLMLAENVVDPATWRAGECVYAQRVLEGFPAQQAGVRDGDLLVALDGKPIAWFFAAAPPPATGPAGERRPEVNPARARFATNEKIDRFTQHIKRRTPGSKVIVRVLRASTPRKIQLAVAAEAAKTLDGAAFVPVPGVMTGTSPLSVMNTRGGFLVRSLADDSPARRAGLDPLDMVLSLNDAPVPAGSDAGILPKLFEPIPPGSSVTLEVARLETVELPLVIGRRPVSRLNPQDLLDAQEAFASWWRQQTGELSVPRPAESPNVWPADISPPKPQPGVAP